QALGEEAAVIAEPVVVDRRVQARQEPVDDLFLRLDRRVAADVAAGAHRLRLREVPDAAAEPELLQRQRSDRADVRGAARPVVRQRAAVVRPDERAASAIEERQLGGARDLLAEADAARALDAPRHVGDDVRADHRAVEGRELALLFVVLRKLLAVAEGVVLEGALAGLVADRAVQRVVDQQELHRRRAGASDFLGRRLDRETVLQGHRASGLDLGHALDFDQAHAALADDREARVEAEVGDVDARALGGIDQVDVLGHLDRPPVEDHRECVLLRRRRSRWRRRRRITAHAVTRAAFGPTMHLLCSTWCMYSSRNLLTEERGGAIAASAKTQIVMPLAIWLQMRDRRSTSSTRPSPRSMRERR